MKVGEVMKTQELFQNFLQEIANQVSPGTFSVWFNDLKLVSIDDNEIVIKVPLPVHKQIITNSYMDILDDAIFSLTGKN